MGLYQGKLEGRQTLVRNAVSLSSDCPTPRIAFFTFTLFWSAGATACATVSTSPLGALAFWHQAAEGMASARHRTAHRIIQDLLIVFPERHVKGRALRCHAPAATLMRKFHAQKALGE